MLLNLMVSKNLEEKEKEKKDIRIKYPTGLKKWRRKKGGLKLEKTK